MTPLRQIQAADIEILSLYSLKSCNRWCATSFTVRSEMLHRTANT